MTNISALMEDPTQVPAAHRVAMLTRNDRLFHIILAQQFDAELIERLCRLAEMIRNVADAKQGSQYLCTLLSHKRAMLYFIQPSTRTFTSFSLAAIRTHRNTGFGVRLGTTETTNPRASASPERLKLTLMINP